MIAYLIKSTACLLIFFMFYRLVLEKQSNHVFKRFYLLGSLVAGLVIPLLILGEQVIAVPETTNLEGVLPDPQIGDPLLATSAVESGQILTYEYLLNPNFWEAFYLLGLIIFGALFIGNLGFLLLKIYRNQRLPETAHTKVLLKQSEPPHTFLRFLFLDQQAYREKKIPTSVLEHEQTHISEKHSLDVLLAESLRLVFWFQPLVWAYCKAIRLNHEFLADRSVIARGYSTLEYQYALLEFAQNRNQPALSHAIHYSSIKKRIQVMKTNTSKRRSRLALLLLTPIFALTLLSFSSRKITYQRGLKENVTLVYLSPDALEFNGAPYAPELAARLVKKIAHKNTSITIEAPSEITSKTVARISNAFQKEGLEQIRINADTYRMPEAEYTKEVPGKAASVLMQADRLVLEKEATIANFQDSATREEMKEYNALAKKYNAMIEKGNILVDFKEVKRMKYLFGKMSEKQRADAEPFPDLPKPPPPPATPDQDNYPAPPPPPAAKPAFPGSKAAAGTIGGTPPPPPPAPGAVSMGRNYPQSPPPPPPAPTMEEILAKLKASGMENTTFYFNGKSIDAKRAIQIMEDEEANVVSIINKKDGTTAVKLSN